MASRGLSAVVLAVVAAVPASAGGEKPSGGICECGAYIEAPVSCTPLGGTKRDACISANLKWIDKCNAWRGTICRAPAAESVKTVSQPPVLRPVSPPVVAVQPPPAAPPPVSQPAMVAVSPTVQKYGGAWRGLAQCRLESWHIAMDVAQLADGSLLTSATSGQATGGFTKIDLSDDGVVLHFNTWIHETLYTGHLVAPNRIEGTVPTNAGSCKWYLAR